MTTDERPEKLKDDLLPAVLQLRLAQLMLQMLLENPDVQAPGPQYFTRRALKETIQKIDWCVGVANRNSEGKYLGVQAEWDDRLASMANLTSFIADHPDGMSSIVDMLTSKSNHREMMRKCWLHARVSYDRHYGLELDFDAWYNETFTTKTSNHGPVQ